MSVSNWKPANHKPKQAKTKEKQDNCKETITDAIFILLLFFHIM